MEIIGHKIQWKFLKKLAKRDKVPQALLFTGVDSVGKRKIALEFIKLLNCQEKDFQQKPCQKCLHCSLIEKMKHPDVILITPKNKEIQINQIRELQKKLSFQPQLSFFKSVIIDKAEALNPMAQNCLLKTLEEPPGKTLFLLITSQPHLLFETIRSRCGILKFYPVKPEEIESSFKKTISPQIRILAEGRPGRVIEFLNQPEKFERWVKGIGKIQELFNKGIPERFEFVKKFFEKENPHFPLPLFLEIFNEYLRIVFLKKLGIENKNLEIFSIPSNLENYSILKIKKIIEEIQNLKVLISSTNVNPKLALENLMLVL